MRNLIALSRFFQSLEDFCKTCVINENFGNLPVFGINQAHEIQEKKIQIHIFLKISTSVLKKSVFQQK